MTMEAVVADLRREQENNNETEPNLYVNCDGVHTQHHLIAWTRASVQIQALTTVSS